MQNQHYLHLETLDAPVRLQVDSAFLAALPAVFARWPFTLSDTPAHPSFADIRQHDTGFTLDSPFLEKPLTYRDPTNMLCALVVEIAWQRLRQDTRLLCLHGAAVEYAGRLVIFPSTARAGKSVLSTALSAQGRRLFTDDFLPLRIGDKGRIEGVANGISARVRLPLPKQIGRKARRYINTCKGIENAQYRYVTPKAGELASVNTRAPLGAMVFLERNAGMRPSLEPVDQADALKSLIKQNFSRAVNAGAILNMLGTLTRTAPAYRLTYDTVAQAGDLLDAAFSRWTTPEPAIDSADESALFAPAAGDAAHVPPDTRTATLMQAPGVTEVATGDKRFLSGDHGTKIHYLNDGASVIWRLLAEPAIMDDTVAMMQALFPDQPASGIRADVTGTIEAFARNGLLVDVDTIRKTSPDRLPLSEPVNRTA